MSDIIIRDANNVSRTIRTYEDSTSVHHNASVPINVSGLPIFVTAAPGIVAGVVSVTPEGGNFPVSVAGQVSLAPQLLVVSGLVTVVQQGALFTQIQGQYLAAPPTIAAGAVSTVQLDVNGNQKVVPGNPFVVSIGAPLPAGTNHLGKVSVEGLTIGAGSGLTVSVGGAVSAQAVPVGYSDGSNYRIPYADASGVQRVSVQGTVSISDKVSVAGIVGLQAGTALIGAVSISPNGLNIPTSVASTGSPNADGISFGAAHSLRVMNAGFVYNRASDTWDRMTGTSIGLDVIGKARYSATLPTLADGAVSVLQVGSRGSLNVTLVSPDSTGTIGLTNSMADAKANNINRIPTEDYMMVYNTSGGNWDRWDGKVSVGAIAATQSGTWTVQPGNTPNTAPWLVTDVPSSVGGLTMYTAIVSAITSGTLVKGAAGQIYSITAGNKGVTPLYLKLYNTATAPAASTSVNCRFIIPGTSNGGGFVLNIDKGLAFSAGIGYNITGELLPGDTTAPADNQGFINIFYK